MKRFLVLVGIAAVAACGTAPGDESVETANGAITAPVAPIKPITTPVLAPKPQAPTSVAWTSANWPLASGTVGSLAVGPGTAVSAAEATYVIPSSGPYANQLWYTGDGVHWTPFPTPAPAPLAFVAVGPVGGELWAVSTTGTIYYWNASSIVGGVTPMTWLTDAGVANMFPAGSQCAAVNIDGSFWFSPGASSSDFLLRAVFSPTLGAAKKVSINGVLAGSYTFENACSHLAISASGTAWMSYPTAATYSTAYYSSSGLGSGTSWTSAGLLSPAALIATDSYGNAYTETSGGVVEAYPWPTGPWTALPGTAPVFAALAAGVNNQLWATAQGESNVLVSSDACVEEPASYTCSVFFCGEPQDNCGQTAVCSPCVAPAPPPRTAGSL